MMNKELVKQKIINKIAKVFRISAGVFSILYAVNSFTNLFVPFGPNLNAFSSFEDVEYNGAAGLICLICVVTIVVSFVLLGLAIYSFHTKTIGRGLIVAVSILLFDALAIFIYGIISSYARGSIYFGYFSAYVFCDGINCLIFNIISLVLSKKVRVIESQENNNTQNSQLEEVETEKVEETLVVEEVKEEKQATNQIKPTSSSNDVFEKLYFFQVFAPKCKNFLFLDFFAF